MTAPRYDVLGIGNAIVDVIARAEDDFLVKQNMQKGGMALIDEDRARRRSIEAMGPATEISGGSAANTIAGIASFGARAAFVGKVATTSSARYSPTTSARSGSRFDTPRGADGPSTARCYIMVTPDGERTMNTYLGAAQNLLAGRHRSEADRRRRHHLSRRLSVGSAARQGSLPQGGEGRARRRTAWWR